MENEKGIQVFTQSGIIIQAMESDKIFTVDPDKLFNQIAISFQTAATMLGQRPSETETRFAAESLSELIRTRYQQMRLKEIPIAFERGVLGEYGDFFGLNVVSCTKFIKSYLESEERRSAVKALLTDTTENIKPSESDLIAMENAIILNAFDQFKITGKYDDFGSHIYNKLDERKLIKITPDRKRELMRHAMMAVKARNSPSTALSSLEHRKLTEFSKVLTGAFKTIEDKGEISADQLDAYTEIIKESKYIALMEYFSSLIEMEIELKDLLN